MGLAAMTGLRRRWHASIRPRATWRVRCARRGGPIGRHAARDYGHGLFGFIGSSLVQNWVDDGRRGALGM
jgi:hypothetical protein